jgi:hypothetical protein
MPPVRAQVLANRPFDQAISRARALEAGATATDLPHHVHYDLKLYNHKGKLTTGTWDIWRDPQHYIRADIVAGDFRYTHIEDLTLKKNWRHFNSVMPLKVYDLRQKLPRSQLPRRAICGSGAEARGPLPASRWFPLRLHQPDSANAPLLRPAGACAGLRADV